MLPDFSTFTPFTLDDVLEWWYRLQDVYRYEDELQSGLNVGRSSPAIGWDVTKNPSHMDPALQALSDVLANLAQPSEARHELATQMPTLSQIVGLLSRMGLQAEETLPRAWLLLHFARAYERGGNPRAAINCLHMAAAACQTQRAYLALLHLALAVVYIRSADLATARAEWAYGRGILVLLTQNSSDFRQARRWQDFMRFLPERIAPPGSPPPGSLWSQWPPRPPSWTPPPAPSRRPRARPRPLPPKGK